MPVLKIFCWLVIAAIFLSKTAHSNSTLLLGMVFALIAIFIAEKVSE